MGAGAETGEEKRIKVPAISTKSENQLNLLRLSITGTDADFAGMNLAEAVTNECQSIRGMRLTLQPAY